MTEEDIAEFSERTGLTVFEASAKAGTGVESSFIALTDALVEVAASKNPKKKYSTPDGDGSSTSVQASGVVGSNDANPYYYDNEGE